MKELPKCPLKYFLVLTLGKSFLRLYDTRKVPSRSRNLHALVLSVSTLGKHLPSWLLLNLSAWETVNSEGVGLPWRASGWDSTLPLQGAQIQSLVRELKSCMLYDAVKKNKEKKFLICFPCLKKKTEGFSTFLFASSFKFWPPSILG